MLDFDKHFSSTFSGNSFHEKDIAKIARQFWAIPEKYIPLIRNPIGTAWHEWVNEKDITKMARHSLGTIHP